MNTTEDCLKAAASRRMTAKDGIRITLEHLARMAEIEVSHGAAGWEGEAELIEQALADLEIL